MKKNEIEAKIDEILENEEVTRKLTLEEKIKKISKSELKGENRLKFQELKIKYKFIHRFKYEKSQFLKAVEKGEWVLLDGIENSPSSIIEKITLLCGDKPELNLFESGQESINPKEGFHLFMTYNPDRINHNESIPNILFDKCLIYHLDSFINNEQALSQIIYGFLINSNYYSIHKDFFSDIASRISNIHLKIKEKLENDSEKISERTLIKFCKKLDLSQNNMNAFSLSIKNNFLYFYFPSSDKNIYEKIIDNLIDEKGAFFSKLAKNYITECHEQLNRLYLLEENIKGNKNDNFNLGEFIFYSLNIPFEYLKNLHDSINEVIIKADDANYDGIYYLLNPL